MKRRDFIVGLGSAAAWSRPTWAQQPIPKQRVAILMLYEEEDPEGQVRIAAFQQRLKALGWETNRNIEIAIYWGVGDIEWARSRGREILSKMPNVVLANGDTAIRALQPASTNVPVIFIGASDPVAQGYIKSLAHPGGNMTGFTVLETTVGPKWVGLLKEIAPQVTRVGVLYNPDNSGSVLMSRATVAGAASFSVEVESAPIHEAADIEATMGTLGRTQGGGLIVPPDPRMAGHRKLIIELAGRHKLPAIYALRSFTADGGLISYGISIPDLFRQAAVYVDRILRGEMPAELPVQSPTKFELIINVKTAKELGLRVPQDLLVAADEVIE
jgi:putative tryptophan/tyrosine transport system substrate-binding protein